MAGAPLTYLSLHPEGLRECFVFGGVPGLDRSAREIYEGTFPFVEERNRQYFEKFPMDKERLVKLCRHLRDNDVRLPNGDRLTPRLVQLLGLKLGFVGTAEEIHFLLEEALIRVGDREIVSHAFLKGFAHSLRFDTNPIFAILHEAIYAQGSATNWACAAVQKELYPHYDDFDDFRFYGEMIFPWMFDEISELRGMKAAAEILRRQGRLAGPLRPGRAAPQHRADRLRGLRQRHVCQRQVLAGNHRLCRQHEVLGDQRVRALRPA